MEYSEYTKLVPSIDDIDSSRSGPAIGHLQAQAAEIRLVKINWASYLQGQFITPEHYQFILQYDRAPGPEKRDSILKENPHLAAKVFVYLLNKMAMEQTTQYLLTMVDDMLQEDKTRVELFRNYFIKVEDSMMDNFFGFLRRENRFIVYQASRIIAKIACWSTQLMDKKDLQYFMRWIQDQFDNLDNEYLQTVARNLQMMLRIRAYRLVFIENGGIETIVTALSGKLNTQIQYQLIFCLWCLSFDNDVVPKLFKTLHLVSSVSDIVRQTEREKIIRVSLALFRFLLEKLEGKAKIRECALAMVQCKVLKQLELLQQKDYAHDPELSDDLAFLVEMLSANVQDVSSLEEYVTELKSGRLEWSPVHRAEKFWRENADKFVEKNYEILKMLIKLLETSKDPVVLQVAIHDMGEFVRHYPRGKQVIEKLGAKKFVMDLLNDNDPNVRYHALISLQKIMVQNWEYLGKQLESPGNQQNSAMS